VVNACPADQVMRSAGHFLISTPNRRTPDGTPIVTNAKSQSQIADEIREKANKAAAPVPPKTPKADTVKADTAKEPEAKADTALKEPQKDKERAAQGQQRRPGSRAVPAGASEDRPAARRAQHRQRQPAQCLQAGQGRRLCQEGFRRGLPDAGRRGREGQEGGDLEESLRIARWLGMDLGSQLDMFEQDARVPAVDRAYEEGKSQAMQGISLKCDYAQETEQYRTFAAGWHHGQEVLSKGFKKLHPEVEADEKAKLIKKTETEAAKVKDAKEFDAPASGVAMTRSQFNEQKQAKPN
jgi:hypothetical protein